MAGKKFFTVLDEYVCEALRIIDKLKMNKEDMMGALYPLPFKRGKSEHIRSNNGSEFIATHPKNGLRKVGIKTILIYRGSHWIND